MGPTVINGLPAHVLLVHAVVVLIPLTALVLISCAVSPVLQRQLGVLLPLLALVSLAVVPLTTHAGEWLEHHMDRDPLLRAHARLGDSMLPWAAGLFVVAALVWWWGRRTAAADADGAGAGRGASVPVRVVVALVALVVSAGAVVQVYRIGDSGAKAAWHDQVSATAHGDSDDK